MGEKGKAYANRKPKAQRPEGDLYHTPKSLVHELLKLESLDNPWECACGGGAITDVLLEHKIKHTSSDLSTGVDFLETTEKHHGDIFTNPPFSLWDSFVTKAKEVSSGKVIMLGRTNYFGTQSRLESGIWDNLRKIYVFSRYVDYQTPLRDDGLFHVGNMCTGWFVWDKTYKWKPELSIIDVSQYAKLGALKKKVVNVKK